MPGMTLRGACTLGSKALVGGLLSAQSVPELAGSLNAFVITLSSANFESKSLAAVSFCRATPSLAFERLPTSGGEAERSGGSGSE
eukprot:scaffold41791_cov29-Tisochrysis_lutea.AAC.7